MCILLFRMKKWQIITFSYCKFKIDKSLLFPVEKNKFLTYSDRKIKYPQPDTKLLLSALIKKALPTESLKLKKQYKK